MQNSRSIREFKFWFADLLVFSAAFLLSYIAWFHFKNSPLALANYREAFISMLVFHTLVTLGFNPYRNFLVRGYLKEMYAVFKHVLSVFLMMIAYIFAVHVANSVSRLVLFTFIMNAFVMVYVERIVFKKILKIYLKKTNNHTSILLVTVPLLAQSVVPELIKLPNSAIKGIVNYEYGNTVSSLCGIEVVAGKNDALGYIKSNWVDEIYVVLPNNTELDKDFIESCKAMGITMKLSAPKIEGFTYPNKSIERIGGLTYVAGRVTNPDPTRLAIKRLIDIIGSLVGIIITCVLTVFVAPIIFIQSPGPIFFRQERVGKNGKKFKIIKFRTMYTDAEERKAELMKDNKMNGLMFKMDNDPRIFPFGRILRKLSIDEFPQFFNIFLGQMSLVGTRPPTVDEYMQYDYHHKARLAMKPGLTGMWQVSGRSNITDFEKVVEMDVGYIENWSLALDLKILFKTVGAVLCARGSE
ncbi:MAG: sugar transferase [Acutalibacteraceae bacterium]